MLTNKEILQIALTQSAIDSGCRAEDFLADESITVHSRPHPDARRYLKLPFFCDLTSYGRGIVASVAPEIEGDVLAYIRRYPAEHCFETPHLHVLNAALEKHGMAACFMAEYFLPDAELMHPLTCPYETKILTQSDFAPLYLPQWSNALCEQRKHLDTLGVGAYDNGELIGFAGASADCDTMWQIGIDVLPAYRRQGIAAALVSRLACEILARDIVPFYCCAWSNVASARCAIRSGFRPAWVQLTAKSREFVDGMNQDNA